MVGFSKLRFFTKLRLFTVYYATGIVENDNEEDEDEEESDGDLNDEDFESFDEDEEDLEKEDFDDDFVDEDEVTEPVKKKKKISGKSNDLHSLLAAADEFSAMIDENAQAGQNPDTLGAIFNKDKSHAKQMKWESKRMNQKKRK